MIIPPMLKSIFSFVIWLGFTFVAAIIGAIASANARSFYKSLSQPVWAPPAYIFAPVWTLLYLLMTIAVWIVWRTYGFQHSGAALWLFVVQLALNALWTWIFFHWHLGALAFVEIVVLWLILLATTISFWRLRPLSGVLLLPYLAWVTFAAFLTYSVWKRNPNLLA